MQNMHRQSIITKFLRSGNSLSSLSFNEEDIKQPLLMLSNVHDSHEERTGDIKLPLTFEGGRFHLQTCECWNGCGRLTVAADHPTYCEVCERECEIASQSHEADIQGGASTLLDEKYPYSEITTIGGVHLSL